MLCTYRKKVVAITCVPIIDRLIQDGINGYKSPAEDYILLYENMIKVLSLKVQLVPYICSTKKEFIELFLSL